MRILLYRYNSLCEPDIIQSLTSLGHEVLTVDIEMHSKNPKPQDVLDAVYNKLNTYNFDAVMSINYYPLISEVCRICNVPYLAWTVDSPVVELLSNTVANATNRIFCFDYEQYQRLQPYNPEGVFYLPLATNVERWDAVIHSATEKEHARFASDISFVGSLYTEKCPYDALKNLPQYYDGYFRGLMEAQKNVYGYFFLNEVLTQDAIDVFKKHMPNYYVPPELSRVDDASEIALKYMGMKVTSMERLEVMRILGEKYKVDIYTGSDTGTLPVTNKGFAKTLTEMPLVFHNSKINLNITCRSIRTGLSQRIWDIMGAGGFVLTNYQAEIPEYFVAGEDLEMYGSMDELREKVAFYLSHDDIRKKIALSGYERVRQNHTHVNRMKTMLDMAGLA